MSGVTIGLAILALVWIASSKTPGMKYTNELGVPALYSDYSKIIQMNGIVEIRESISEFGVPQKVVYFDDYILTFIPQNSSESGVGTAIDYSDQYQLITIKVMNGDHSIHLRTGRIGIGSSKSEVEKVFQEFMKSSEKSGFGSGYYDSDFVFIRFLYDDRGCVTSITISIEV